MTQVDCLDHLAITVADVATTLAFYRDLLGSQKVFEYAPNGKVLSCQITLGGSLLSVHQLGNGIDLVAKKPTPGAADFCMRWKGSIESAAAHLRKHNVEVIDGPSPRKLSDGRPSHSVYFRDPDGNLLELMAADPI